MKTTKHRSTLPPFCCAHCGYMWYGWTSTSQHAPNTILCTSCYNALYNYIWDRTEADDGEHLQLASTWIADKSKKPHPRTERRRYHSSVPKWMRSAIVQDFVQINKQETVYVVYSEGDTAIRAEIVDKSTLKPFAIR